MPRISKEEALAKRNEILDACCELYSEFSYREITMAQIADKVSFGRANIYNYFQCKDEIFLALFQREYECWTSELKEIASLKETLDDDKLAMLLAQSLEKRGDMLKLMTVNLYDMEENSRIEALVEFKKTFGESIEALRAVVKKHKSTWDSARIQEFIFALLPYMYGIYPYVFITDKQKEAMEIAGLQGANEGVSGLSFPTIKRLLS